MPQQAWDGKRERQYEHIKSSQKDRGAGEGRAEEIAARTVNKDRAQTGESARASEVALGDVSAEHRGGKRSGNGLGPQSPTKDQLYNDAKRRNVKGRSQMSKQQLAKALGR